MDPYKINTFNFNSMTFMSFIIHNMCISNSKHNYKHSIHYWNRWLNYDNFNIYHMQMKSVRNNIVHIIGELTIIVLT